VTAQPAFDHRRRGRWLEAWRSATETRPGQLGLLLVGIVMLASFAGPWISPRSPIDGDLLERHQGPSVDHPLGTDFLGRDQLARVLHGARASVVAAVGLIAATVLIAMVVGVTSGYFARWVDALLMRVVDIVLAFPTLLLALAVAGFLGPGLRNALVALLAVWWAGFARVIRGQVLTLRSREYITAAVATGASDIRIITRHVIPNLSSTVTVLATVDVGSAVLALAGLSFLNLGIQPPAPEWGRMVFDGKPYIERQPLEMLVPGAAIAVTVLGFNLLGDALRDALDPATNRPQRARRNQRWQL
jgi:ABC-type dipeptide/oligopeptide/nickel transport system permease subunit